MNTEKLTFEVNEALIKQIESLRKENEQLKYWKESEIKVWSDVLDYMHKRKDLKLGASISDYVLKFLKERDELKAALEEFYNRMDQELQREPINRARYMNVLYEIYEDLKALSQKINGRNNLRT